MFNRNILAVKEAQLNALVAESGGGSIFNYKYD